MLRATQRLSLVVFLVLASFVCAAETGGTIAEARALFDAGDYPAASGLLREIAARDRDSGAAVSDAFTEIGIIDYNRKNYKNAYASFREALKLQPINQTATQYYLRMRREMNVAALTNADSGATSSSTASASPGAVSTAQADGTAPKAPKAGDTRVATGAEDEADLKILIAQLKAAESRVSDTDGAAQVRADNEMLRNQLESQRLLVEKMLASQRVAPAAPSRTENAQLQETIRLLSLLAEKDADRPIVVQSDPALQELLKDLRSDREAESNPFSVRNLALVISLVAMSLFLIAVSVVFLLVLRSRKARRNGTVDPYAGSYSMIGSSQDGFPGNSLLPAARSAGLLEYATQGSDLPATEEIGLRAALLKADHLQKMYNDVKAGTLNWDTVRTYIDDLEKSLRVEILRVVEAKLDSEALITPESALPVLFPFLTDYDDFLNDKAQSIAKKVLIESRNEKEAEERDPLFSVQSLLKVPKKLEEVLKHKDRSLVTAKLSLGIARIKGLSKEECDLVYKGALVHDVGYLMLDKSQLQRIISKPEINEEEWDFIKSHVVKGPDYFKEADVPQIIKDAMLHHHERNDGSGYPSGLVKEEIPLVAQIVGIAETFASLVSSRSYRDKLEVSHALAIVKDGARRKFDPELVTALEKVILSNGGNL